MKCIYCHNEVNGKNKGNEHVAPQWIQEFLKSRKIPYTSVAVSRKNEFGKITPGTMNTLAHKVCRDCNNGWLGDIDASCMDYLKQLMTNPYSNKVGSGDEFSDIVNTINIRTLIYKIFLNYLATGPYKEDKLVFYRDFYETKQAPPHVSLFASHVCTPKSINFSHLDNWKIILNKESDVKKAVFHQGAESGLRFKFYAQLGFASFVICCPGNQKGKIIYDPALLQPIIDAGCLPETISLDPHPGIMPDGIINRLLWSIQLMAFNNND